jgi:hypothetical protein
MNLPEAIGYLAALTSSEYGVGFRYWKMLSEWMHGVILGENTGVLKTKVVIRPVMEVFKRR